MSTPLLDAEDTQLDWKNKDQRRTTNYQNQQAQDTIVPDAASLDSSSFYSRLNTIRQDSASATAGAIASDATQKQRAAAIQASKLAAANAAAQDSAYGSLNSFAGGNVGNWGSGGAQGTANVLRAAGFPESAISTMVAIGMAESSLNPNATHSNSNGSIDQGLFQINSIHKNNSWYPTNPMDPMQSAVAAYNIWKGAGGSFRDWSVYNSGKYKDFLQTAPPIQPYVANTGYGLQNAQTGQAINYSGVPTSTSRTQALNIAQQVLNIPYVWGGNSLQTGVDCSGLVQQVYSQMGISMPRTSAQQATTGVRVQSYNQLQPGDLVAFKWSGGWAGANTVSHIAIYLGGGKIIEAAGGSRGDIRSLGNSTQDRGAIYIHTRFPGE